MTNLFNRFVKEESGQDMIEYVLILAFVCVGAAAIVTAIGTDIADIWTKTATHVNNASKAAK